MEKAAESSSTIVVLFFNAVLEFLTSSFLFFYTLRKGDIKTIAYLSLTIFYDWGEFFCSETFRKLAGYDSLYTLPASSFNFEGIIELLTNFYKVNLVF